MAIGWQTKVTKTIISTTGTTAKIKDQKVKRSKVVLRDGVLETVKYSKATASVDVVGKLFSVFNAVDKHDGLRQGILNMELHWETTVWWHRLFATCLGINFTDAYLAYKYDYQRYYKHDSIALKKMLPFREFLGELGYSLVHDSYIVTPMITRLRLATQGESHVSISFSS